MGNIMFNKEQKQEYINFEKESNKPESYITQLTNYFRRLHASEKDCGKDIVDMNEEEVTNTIVSLGIKSEFSKRHLISFLRAYVSWAKMTEKTKNESIIPTISAVDISSKDVIIKKMIKSPEHIREILDNALVSDEQGSTTYTPNKAIRDSLLLWLLYNGLTLEQLSQLKKTDINYKNKTIITNDGKEHKIDDEIVLLWKKCSKIGFVEKKNNQADLHQDSASELYVICKLMDNKYLFRTILGNKPNSDKPISVYTLKKLVIQIFQNSGKPSVSINNINISGAFYKMYLAECENENADIRTIIKTHLFPDIKSNSLHNKVKLAEIDYMDWKIAFGHTQQKINNEG